MNVVSHVNQDPHEVEKFNALAAEWWDPLGAFKTLHDLNPLRVNYIDERAFVEGKRVLDVGCGGGILSEALAKRHAKVTGLDLGPDLLNVARAHSEQSNLSIEYVQSPVETFAEIHRAQFDVVCCLEMLEHVPDPKSVVEACANLVKPGGDVFFSTINRSLKSYVFAVLGAEYVLKLLPKSTHDYGKFIKPSELAQYNRDAALDVQDLTGIGYNPLTQSFRSRPNKADVNYLLHSRKVDA